MQAASVTESVKVTVPVKPAGGVKVGFRDVVLESPVKADAGDAVQDVVTEPVVFE